jgi:hypothetical protein
LVLFIHVVDFCRVRTKKAHPCSGPDHGIEFDPSTPDARSQRDSDCICEGHLQEPCPCLSHPVLLHTRRVLERPAPCEGYDRCQHIDPAYRSISLLRYLPNICHPSHLLGFTASRQSQIFLKISLCPFWPVCETRGSSMMPTRSSRSSRTNSQWDLKCTGVRNLQSATHKWQRRRVQLLIALYQHFYKVAQVNLDTTSPCTPSQYV